ncbi:MAG: hypothetical protein RH917_19155 [Lacipirellulaceae bacterium]
MSGLNQQIDAAKQAEVSQETLTVAQRSRRLVQVCRTAAQQLADRRASGMPDPEPAPWPQSTWDYLKSQVGHVS